VPLLVLAALMAAGVAGSVGGVLRFVLSARVYAGGGGGGD
jgi:hypothetical protein